jgi:membrane protease YdiL (CAAX protease family)
MAPAAIFVNPDTRTLRSGWRIPWLLLWSVPVLAGLQFAGKRVQPVETHAAFLPFKALMALAVILGLLGVYRLFARVVERRRPAELGLDRRGLRHTAFGLLAGGGSMLLIVAVLALTGHYRVEALHGAKVLLRALIFYLPQSFVEDYLFCLVLYRLLREGLGRSAALVIAPLCFAAAHMGNSNESAVGLLEIFTGGCLMYYAFERTGSFWTVWAMHFSWNFFMNGVLGMANSGQAIPGFLQARVTGPAWLTGGATGPEASVLAPLLDVALLLAFILAPARWIQPRGLDAAA